MKKIILFFTLILALFISGCSPEPLGCGEYKNGESWPVDCNTCTCSDGVTSCTEIACLDEPTGENPFAVDEIINEIKFNSDLTSYEREWLTYLEIKYPNSKIYHMRTVEFNCDNCYEISYKKDREVIKIKVLNGEKKSENTVRDDIVTEIENPDICGLFSGEWNECPKLCPTDEEACQNECGLPTCEFGAGIDYRVEGDTCGGLEYGDCEFGLTCFYKAQDDDFGICQKK